MMGPRALILSDKLAVKSTTKKAAMLGGTRSGAVEQANSVEHLMPSVEHSEIYHDASEEPPLKEAQEEAAYHQSGEALGEAEEGADYAPARYQSREIDTCPDLFDNPVARHVDKNIGDVEYQERYVELCSGGYVEVFAKAIDFSVSDVASVDKSK
ncbi:hypothetical protein CKAH01_13387 [Colletotrichum kahawae]|uniref:Uncharacterized protein n=1 Tax=Colletotrichum kahawae TaxID=34407 RepID=A0AAE0DBL1_COLKA|nr:hypothetical protein CKAH01_13387 [Colletotrichum kahawae]